MNTKPNKSTTADPSNDECEIFPDNDSNWIADCMEHPQNYNEKMFEFHLIKCTPITEQDGPII